jgi:ribonuclease P/MRP protein subunit RPP1
MEHAHAALVDAKSALDTYDIVAASPTTDKAFQYACNTMDVDIICFSIEAMQSRLKFQLKHSLMDKARTRGIAFEIPYAAMLTDNRTKRRQFISNASALVQGTGGKGIILSSWGPTAYHCRSPHDVANMGTFFGMSEEQSLDSVSKAPSDAVARRRKIKAHKGRLELAKTPVV